MSNGIPEKVALSPGEFAAVFGKSQTWGYRQLYSGKVKALTGYGRILIPISEVERLLQEAGRYLGQDRPPARKVSKTPEERKPLAEKPNAWKEAVAARKRTKNAGERSRNTVRKNRMEAVARRSALRKMNRRNSSER